MFAGCLFDSGFSLTDPGTIAAHGGDEEYRIFMPKCVLGQSSVFTVISSIQPPIQPFPLDMPQLFLVLPLTFLPLPSSDYPHTQLAQE